MHVLPLPPSPLELARQVADDGARHLQLRCRGQRVLAAVVEQHHGILVAAEAVLHQDTVVLTSSGSFLARRLASAYSARFSLSAAKPMQNGGLGRAATSARMSGLASSLMVFSFSPFFIFWRAASAGR